MTVNEYDLEFSLLTSLVKGEGSIVSRKWDLMLFDDNTIIGKLYFKPLDSSLFLNIEVERNDNGTFRARFKPFSLIQKEFDYEDFNETEISENEKRLIVFLLFHKEYVEKLESKIKKKIIKKLGEN